MLSLPITFKQLALLQQADDAVTAAMRDYSLVFKAILASHNDLPEGARFNGIDPEASVLNFTLPPEIPSGESDS